MAKRYDVRLTAVGGVRGERRKRRIAMGLKEKAATSKEGRVRISRSSA
jgi:hypothetical protein